MLCQNGSRLKGMRYLEALLAGVALSSVLVAACVENQGPPCAVQSCPPISKVAFFSPTGLPSPLIAVTGDSTCIALRVLDEDGGSVDGLVQVQELLLTAGQSAVCQLHGTLADGTEVAGALTFKPVMNGCCPDFTTVPPTFISVDGGTDAR